MWHQNPQKNLVEKKGLKEEGEDENSTEQIKRKMEEEYDENVIKSKFHTTLIQFLKKLRFC